jgi:hypothetical protein
VELDEHRRMIRQAARRLQFDAGESEVGQIQIVDEDVDHADRMFSSMPSSRTSGNSVG